MYLKITTYPVDYGKRLGLERHRFEEVDDDFMDWPEDDREDLIAQIRQEAVFDYVETEEMVFGGNPEDDKDY
jgi:hypothetical protein